MNDKLCGKSAFFFIDYEAFQHGKEDGIIIKELCVMAADNPLKSGCFVFKPPFEWTCLRPDQQGTYSYEERCLHHLSWAEGDVQFCADCVQNSLTWFAGMHNVVFLALGEQKVRILQNKLPKLCILDYRDIDARCKNVSLHNLPTAPTHITCTYRNHGRIHCAVLKCFRLSMHYHENFVRR